MNELPFLAAMSHEIRTPMNGVLGLLELLGLGRLDAEQRATVELAERSARELLRILDDILDFARIGSGRLEVRHEAVSLCDDVLEGVWRTHVGNALGKDLSLTRQADPRISPALMADPLRLAQILHNFTSNAIKFTACGSVALCADLVDEDQGTQTVRFSVSDTGIGIAPEAQKRLFKPFSQAEDSTERRFGGSGLGLAICRGLADAMGGEIAMHSVEGEGTRMSFTVTMAVADPAPRAALSPVLGKMLETVTAQPGLSGSRHGLVLVVDDHTTNRQVMLRQLRALGYQAEAAANGIEALHKWRSGRFAFVITDCQMPGMDGFALARRIRDEELARGLERVPLVACTANVQASEMAACFEAGMDDFLAKPAAMNSLAKLLGKWLPLEARAEVLLDGGRLAELAGGNPALTGEILGEFDTANAADHAALGMAFAHDDLAAIGRIAHAIKGAAQTVGAMRYAAAAAALESAWRSGDAAAARSARAPFEAAYAELRQELQNREFNHAI